jgi:hypothetical protein
MEKKMENEILESVEEKGSTREVIANTERKAYAAPTLRHYGSLTELVQANPGRGQDGGTTGRVDCTLS